MLDIPTVTDRLIQQAIVQVWMVRLFLACKWCEKTGTSRTLLLLHKKAPSQLCVVGQNLQNITIKLRNIELMAL